MLKTLFLIYAAYLSFGLYGQTRITFNVDVQLLIEKNFFSPSEGESLFVRGSFNRWEDDNYRLMENGDSNVYSGTFNIDAGIGDTLEYKFLIKKADGRIYWEDRPDTSNANYGNRRLIVNGADLFLPAVKFNHDEFIHYPIKFSGVKLREDFIQALRAVEEYHPALYDYTPKEILDSLFNHYYSKIETVSEFCEFYGILSTVLEKIGCGHTKLWIPSVYWNAAPDKFFPLRLLLSNNKVLIEGFYSDTSAVPLGSEILTINNEPVKKILNKLAETIPADAFNRAFKFKSAEGEFSKRYALSYGYPENFRISFIPPGKSLPETADLPPASLMMINRIPARGSTLSLNLLDDGKTALLTINTFIYYDKLKMFRAFIDSSFQVIRKKKIDNLIIDLRGNDGGDPFCSSYLLSYIERKPVPYFAEYYGRYDSLAEPLPKADNYFKGTLYTLIDGKNFSTTGHFCSLLKYHKIGALVGSETGATYTCTGSVKYIDLKHTKLILGTARKQRYSTAVRNMDRTRGVMPDYHVEQSQEDLINGKDTVLDFVLNLIKTGGG